MQKKLSIKSKSICTLLLMSLLVACSTVGTSSKNNSVDEKKKKIAEINIELGMAYLEAKDVQRAKQKLLAALESDPSLPEVQYSMAYFFEATGDKEQANTYYLQAIALAPNRGDAQNNYGTYLCRMGDYRNSVLHFKAAVADPKYLDTAGAYENAGLCALKIPDQRQALDYFNHAVLQDANRPVSLMNAAELEFKLGNYAAARQRLRDYLLIAPASRQTDALGSRLQRLP
jgi:type IV pilus assembly protein PilF